ncbi:MULTISPECIES: hypothetical protein [unclassified Arsukibacterium]|uniref:hypothetical protein n=1 Tax=unclassified Arsukibacterium TaxID=2635278 RepID=UPI000C5364E8|nr:MULTISPECIES: hypothetical protein [unclassified Arsukibacterium]MAA96117.1 hypothetical protein [Rheinheimera sp.]MBM35465.1 hypothetical protein [Rheinheimera sp.]HAW93619.1 hypothetical protein [Candidatus Azambacteria bacterium]|tara:strand:- start:100 stop:429 length:330 start_codon:yes stop_codon:yes gene_type:complete
MKKSFLNITIFLLGIFLGATAAALLLTNYQTSSYVNSKLTESYGLYQRFSKAATEEQRSLVLRQLLKCDLQNYQQKMNMVLGGRSTSDQTIQKLVAEAESITSDTSCPW